VVLPWCCLCWGVCARAYAGLNQGSIHASNHRYWAAASDERRRRGKPCLLCQCAFHRPTPAMGIAASRRPCYGLHDVCLSPGGWSAWGTSGLRKPLHHLNKEQAKYPHASFPHPPLHPYTPYRTRTQGTQGGDAIAAGRPFPLSQPWPPSKVRLLALPFFFSSPRSSIIIIIDREADKIRMVEELRGALYAARRRVSVMVLDGGWCVAFGWWFT